MSGPLVFRADRVVYNKHFFLDYGQGKMKYTAPSPATFTNNARDPVALTIGLAIKTEGNVLVSNHNPSINSGVNTVK